ncbi:cytochrome P450 [Actinomadura sp. NPDC049753]|uniref:cytochrome P450 n=1 Tax=Actinomadura sp. NPDC049753 TaxID=3154739 RepID=UPI0034295E57
MTSQPAPDAGVFPVPRACPFALPPEYERLLSGRRAARARMAGGNSAWLVARHEDARKVLSDPRMSVDRRREGFPRFAPVTEEERQASFRGFRPPMNWMDPPEHTAARRSVRAEFSPARTEALRPRVQEIVDRRLELMAAAPRPVDLVRELAVPVPSLVICELLGVPYSAHGHFEERTGRMFSHATPAAERTRAAHEIRSLLAEVVADKERDPPDDLLGRLIARGRREGAADREAVVSMAFVLLVAGHSTTADMIALGALTLLEHPDQLASMLADPARTPLAVDELLRYLTVVNASTARTALADVEVGGVTVRAGEGVVVLGPAANRDPEVFERPDEFDVGRGGGRHLAFGAGRHRCLGHRLARMELQIVFDALFRRLPGLRLAVPFGELSFKEKANIYGVRELPVTW